MTVTGRDIIDDLVIRMRTESEPLRYSSLAHGVYRVFLHRDDYDRLAPARRTIVEEATRALDEEIERINTHRSDAGEPMRRWLQAAARLVKPVDPPLRRPIGGWVIELFPDEDEELAPGCFRITSELMLPVTSGALGGDATHRVQPVGPIALPTPVAAPVAPPVMEVAPVQTSPVPPPVPTSVVTPDPVGPSPLGPSPVAASPVLTSPVPTSPVPTTVPPAASGAPSADATRRTDPTATARTTRAAWGELTYRDNLGREHTAWLDADLVRVGRGGTDTVVDVVIQGPEDVSRVHLHLRRDRGGEVFLKDVSRFGTTLDNERVPPSLDGSGADADRWVSLRPRAQIGLAGVVVLHYRAIDAV
jgi:hypothetical protein